MAGNAHGSKRAMERDHYVIRGGVEGRERLRILARVMRPTTLRLFDRVGIDMGMVCLDLGCGGGDVTLDLAGLVGPGGKVVGWDIDETKLGLAQREAEERDWATWISSSQTSATASQNGSSTPFTQGSCSPISRTQLERSQG